jgi:hypothetical protein
MLGSHPSVFAGGERSSLAHKEKLAKQLSNPVASLIRVAPNEAGAGALLQGRKWVQLWCWTSLNALLRASPELSLDLMDSDRTGGRRRKGTSAILIEAIHAMGHPRHQSVQLELVLSWIIQGNVMPSRTVAGQVALPVKNQVAPEPRNGNEVWGHASIGNSLVFRSAQRQSPSLICSCNIKCKPSSAIGRPIPKRLIFRLPPFLNPVVRYQARTPLRVGVTGPPK